MQRNITVKAIRTIAVDLKFVAPQKGILQEKFKVLAYTVD